MYRQLGDTTLVLPSSVRGLTYLADRHCQFVIATRRSGRSFCISAINNHGKTIAVNAKGCSKSAVGDYKSAICQPSMLIPWEGGQRELASAGGFVGDDGLYVQSPNEKRFR